jgi:hypothetical protein
MNITGSVKCYISKSKVLDPPMPWGDDDLFGIRVIRCSCTVFITGFVTVMYALGMYPKLYYHLVEKNVSSTNSPEGGYIFIGLVLFFFVVGTVIGIITKVYEATNGHLLEAIVPRQINYFLWIIPTITIVMLTSHMFELENRLQMFALMSSTLCTIAPAVVIHSADQVKHHSAKILRNKIEEAFLLSIYVTPAIITVILYGALCIIYTSFNI